MNWQGFLEVLVGGLLYWVLLATFGHVSF